MRALHSALGLALALALAPSPARAQGFAPEPALGSAVMRDVPSPLLGLPVPLAVGGGRPARGGPYARYGADDLHQVVGAGYEYLADWFLLSAGAGYSLTPAPAGAEDANGLRPVDRRWLQVGLGLGVAPALGLADGAGPAGLTLALMPFLRVAGDAALAFEDAVFPVRFRAEGGLLVCGGFDFGLRLGVGASFDYDLTHFADEAVAEAGTVRAGLQLGWLVEESSGYAEDKTPTLLLVGLGAELGAMESPTRPRALSVTVGVSL